MERPSLIDAAGWMALPCGVMWSASFLCTMYGFERPLLSALGTALGLISILVLYRQLTNYRRRFPSSWLHIMLLSFVTCLMAGLLTDAVQYIYFLLFDNGHFLSILTTAIESEEYRQAWQQMQQAIPGASLDEAKEMIQNMTTRDIMLQFIIYNIILAFPISLLAAMPVRAPRSPLGGGNSTTTSQGEEK